MSATETYSPYKHWTKEELRTHLIRVCFKYSREPWLLELVLEALEDNRWDPLNNFDGCSVVQDPTHPCPDCFIHDWLWRTGMGGKEADFIFYNIMLLSGMKKAKAMRRWFGVRVAWVFYYKWGHLRRRNIRKLTPSVSNTLKALGYKKKHYGSKN